MDLAYADLSGANLTGAILSGVDLTGATLYFTKFTDSNTFKVISSDTVMGESPGSGPDQGQFHRRQSYRC